MPKWSLSSNARRASIILLALAVALAAVLFGPVAFAQDGTGDDTDSTEEAQPGNQENVAQAQGVRWQPTTQTRGCGQSRERRWVQYNPPWDGGTKYQWRSSAEALRWGTWSSTGPRLNESQTGWTDTGRIRGSGAGREKEQTATKTWREVEKQTSHCNTNRFRFADKSAKVTQWVPYPEPVWSDTGTTRGCGPDRDKQQTKGTQTRWVDAPELLRWGSWSPTGQIRNDTTIWTDTGRTRGSGANREKEQRGARTYQAEEKRTSHCNTVQLIWVIKRGGQATRWVPDPVDVWEYTETYRGCGPDRERQQTKGTQTRWLDAPEPLRWGTWTDTGQRRNDTTIWTDTGRTRGSGANKEKEQRGARTWQAQDKRTSHCNTVELRWVNKRGGPITRWIPDPEPEPYRDTSPDFGTITIPDITATVNQAITSVTLPAATGGNKPLTYSLTPALPAGMSFNAGTRVLSGAPTVLKATTIYTYTVTDSDTTNRDSDTRTFSITVNGQLAPPPAPTGLNPVVSETCDDNGDVTIVLHWGSMNGVSQYQAYKRTVNSVGGASAATQGPDGSVSRDPKSYKRFDGLEPRTEYEFWVKAWGDGETYSTAWGPRSDVASATTGTCTPPLNFTALATVPRSSEWVELDSKATLYAGIRIPAGETVPSNRKYQWQVREGSSWHDAEGDTAKASAFKPTHDVKGPRQYRVKVKVDGTTKESDPVTVKWVVGTEDKVEHVSKGKCGTRYDSFPATIKVHFWDNSPVAKGGTAPNIVEIIQGIPILTDPYTKTTEIIKSWVCVKAKFITETAGSESITVGGTLHLKALTLADPSAEILDSPTLDLDTLAAQYTTSGDLRDPKKAKWSCDWCKGGSVETRPFAEVKFKFLRLPVIEAKGTHVINDGTSVTRETVTAEWTTERGAHAEGCDGLSFTPLLGRSVRAVKPFKKAFEGIAKAAGYIGGEVAKEIADAVLSCGTRLKPMLVKELAEEEHISDARAEDIAGRSVDTGLLPWQHTLK